MTRFVTGRTIKAGLTAALMLAVAACTTAPPPPPPTVVRIPQRPYPPMGAAPNLTIPARTADGTRLTVNSGIGSAQAIWNLRSAYNVAALNCRSIAYEPILNGYSQFLKTHAKALSAVNAALDKEFKTRHGSSYIRMRETYQTQVYNYFALPPVLPAFCDATMQLTQEIAAVPPGQLESYAPAGLAKLESVYQDFFNRYEQYRIDLAAWEAQYGQPQPASAPMIGMESLSGVTSQ